MKRVCVSKCMSDAGKRLSAAAAAAVARQK